MPQWSVSLYVIRFIFPDWCNYYVLHDERNLLLFVFLCVEMLVSIIVSISITRSWFKRIDCDTIIKRDICDRNYVFRFYRVWLIHYIQGTDDFYFNFLQETSNHECVLHCRTSFSRIEILSQLLTILFTIVSPDAIFLCTYCGKV